MNLPGKSTGTQEDRINSNSRKYVSDEKPKGTIPLEQYNFKEWAEKRKHIKNDLTRNCVFE